VFSKSLDLGFSDCLLHTPIPESSRELFGIFNSFHPPNAEYFLMPRRHMKRAKAIPSPRGEGQDEGECKTQIKLIECPPSPNPLPKERAFTSAVFLKNSRDWICRTVNQINSPAEHRVFFDAAPPHEAGERIHHQHPA
jgi:hypothetical protein